MPTLLLTNGVAIGNYGTLARRSGPASKLIGEGLAHEPEPTRSLQHVRTVGGLGRRRLVLLLRHRRRAGRAAEISAPLHRSCPIGQRGGGWTILTSEGYATNTLALTDCQLRGGYLSMVQRPVQRVPYVASQQPRLRTDLHFTQANQTTPYPASLLSANNLFWGGSLSIVALSANNTWEPRTTCRHRQPEHPIRRSSPLHQRLLPDDRVGPAAANNKTLTAVDFRSAR